MKTLRVNYRESIELQTSLKTSFEQYEGFAAHNFRMAQYDDEYRARITGWTREKHVESMRLHLDNMHTCHDLRLRILNLEL